MENKFEKMDQWMMKASREVREQRIPQRELDAFHEGVMKKVMFSASPRWGSPYLGFVLAAVFSLAIIFGAVFYFHQLRVAPEEKPVKAEVRLIREAQAPMAPVTMPLKAASAPLSSEFQIPSSGKREQEDFVSSPGFSVKTEDLLEEIEALKELGVWSEEDEEEAGIPIEAAFAELENYMGENQSAVVIAPAAVS